MKLGRYHHRDEICDPDEVDRLVYAEDEALLRGFAERYFPDGAGATQDMVVCMFTNTADEHWVLDTLPGLPQVSVAAGFSGHGFKMASVIGEVMADLAQSGTTRHDISCINCHASETLRKQAVNRVSSAAPTPIPVRQYRRSNLDPLISTRVENLTLSHPAY